MLRSSWLPFKLKQLRFLVRVLTNHCKLNRQRLKNGDCLSCVSLLITISEYAKLEQDSIIFGEERIPKKDLHPLL